MTVNGLLQRSCYKLEGGLHTKVTGKTLMMPLTWKSQISCYCCTVMLYLERASSISLCKMLQFNDLILSHPFIENCRFGLILSAKNEFVKRVCLGPQFWAPASKPGEEQTSA